MISAELLQMLRCPDDRSTLSEAEAPLIAKLNAEIAANRLRNRGGEIVTQTFEGGLIRNDRRYLYPIVDGIPILLVDEAVPLTTGSANGSGTAH